MWFNLGATCFWSWKKLSLINLMFLSVFRWLDIYIYIRTQTNICFFTTCWWNDTPSKRNIKRCFCWSMERFVLLVDFIALDMEEDCNLPLILERRSSNSEFVKEEAHSELKNAKVDLIYIVHIYILLIYQIPTTKQ